jgi:hypothetical protein
MHGRAVTLTQNPSARVRFALFTVASLFVLAPNRALAVPSFSRQTGMKCAVCHTVFPQLTPYGRWFKLNGYVDGEASKLPPIAFMLQGAPGYTITGRDQPGGAAPHFGANNNWSLNQISGFYAGRLIGPWGRLLFGDRVGEVLNHVGAFMQGSWDGVAQGPPSWDNVEIRVASGGEVAGRHVDFGAYVNNNPTLSDVWNTTPAWGYPFSGSGLAPSPAAATLIDGGVSQQVVGVGTYAMFAETLYAEVGLYHSLSADFQRDFGVDPEGETQLKDFAPYWRLALYHKTGPLNGEIGTYGLSSDTYPGRDRSAGSDQLTDVGTDSQVQYLAESHALTGRANLIYEWQDWRASKQLELVEKRHEHLLTSRFSFQYLYDLTYGFDVGYFYTTGSADPTLYGNRNGSPRNDGWTFEVDWLPFNKGGGPRFWRYSNVKFDVQYTVYNTFDGGRRNFDGDNRNAPDNNTLFAEAWFAF